MRKLFYLFIFCFFFQALKAQDFSNKGKDFFLCFPSHVPSGTSLAQMSLFITSDREFLAGSLLITDKLKISQLLQMLLHRFQILRSAAYITEPESNSAVNKGIRVKVNTGQPAVVVYSHIYAGFRTAATLVLPVNVLGKKSADDKAASGLSTGISRSQFQVIAVEANTQVPGSNLEKTGFYRERLLLFHYQILAMCIKFRMLKITYRFIFRIYCGGVRVV